MMILFTLFLITSTAFLYFWWKRNTKLPPGPTGLPIVGYLPWLDPKAPYETLTQLAHKYGPVYGLSLGNIYSVILTDPKTIKRVFSKDVTTGRAPLYLTHGIMHGYGIICAEGYLWKDQRKFAYNCLRKFGASKISAQTEKDKMEKLIMDNVTDFIYYALSLGNGKIVFDPVEPLRHSLGCIMNCIVFGRNWDRNDVTWKWLQHLQEEGTKCIGVAGPINFLPFLRFLPKFKQTINFLMNGKQATHRIYQRIIDEQMKIFLKQHINESDCTNFIDAFLIERQKRAGTDDFQKIYCDEQFNHLLADVFGAGLDTTLTTLRWYLLYMAVNKEAQQLVRDEIKEILQDRLPTVQDMEFLPLVEASIAETQRIRSVVPVGIPHGTLEDMEIDGYYIPKGTMLVPLQWAIHMDENIWKNPQVFDPKRFIDENCKFYKPDSFIPFQTGKRMCIGDDWAKVIMFLFATTILQKFSLDVEDEKNVDLNGDCGITLTPKEHQIIFNVL